MAREFLTPEIDPATALDGFITSNATDEISESDIYLTLALLGLATVEKLMREHGITFAEFWGMAHAN